MFFTYSRLAPSLEEFSSSLPDGGQGSGQPTLRLDPRSYHPSPFCNVRVTSGLADAHEVCGGLGRVPGVVVNAGGVRVALCPDWPGDIHIRIVISTPPPALHPIALQLYTP